MNDTSVLRIFHLDVLKHIFNKNKNVVFFVFFLYVKTSETVWSFPASVSDVGDFHALVGMNWTSFGPGQNLNSALFG